MRLVPDDVGILDSDWNQTRGRIEPAACSHRLDDHLALREAKQSGEAIGYVALDYHCDRATVRSRTIIDDFILADPGGQRLAQRHALSSYGIGRQIRRSCQDGLIRQRLQTNSAAMK